MVKEISIEEAFEHIKKHSDDRKKEDKRRKKKMSDVFEDEKE